MADSPAESDHGGDAAEDAPPRQHLAADDGAAGGADAAARGDGDDIPLALLRCLNKTHPANCTRRVKSWPVLLAAALLWRVAPGRLGRACGADRP